MILLNGAGRPEPRLNALMASQSSAAATAAATSPTNMYSHICSPLVGWSAGSQRAVSGRSTDQRAQGQRQRAAGKRRMPWSLREARGRWLSGRLQRPIRTPTTHPTPDPAAKLRRPRTRRRGWAASAPRTSTPRDLAAGWTRTAQPRRTQAVRVAGRPRSLAQSPRAPSPARASPQEKCTQQRSTARRPVPPGETLRQGPDESRASARAGIATALTASSTRRRTLPTARPEHGTTMASSVMARPSAKSVRRARAGPFSRSAAGRRRGGRLDAGTC